MSQIHARCAALFALGAFALAAAPAPLHAQAQESADPQATQAVPLGGGGGYRRSGRRGGVRRH